MWFYRYLLLSTNLFYDFSDGYVTYVVGWQPDMRLITPVRDSPQHHQPIVSHLTLTHSLEQ